MSERRRIALIALLVVAVCGLVVFLELWSMWE